MKRSEINTIILEADEMIKSFGYHLPDFAYWSAEKFKEKQIEAEEIIRAGCGWDITDYGRGNFNTTGLFLFTLRNGKLADLAKGKGRCYAEKLLISRHNQLAPMHTHIKKAEDIINRGGASLAVEIFGSDQQGNCDEQRGGVVYCDGIRRSFSPGERIILKPGQSITLLPGDWHAFWGHDGDVLVGEVSTVNDDSYDNIFRDKVSRFSDIYEDTAPIHLLVCDYEKWLTP